MTRSEKDILESIENTLKKLLAIEVEAQFDEDATNRDKVKRLYKLGFDNTEMAEIVGTTASSIRGTVSSLKSDGEIDYSGRH